MLPAQAEEALSLLTAALEGRPELEESLRIRWRSGGRDGAAELPDDQRLAADRLGELFPALTHSADDVASLGALFAEPAGAIVLSWCSASTWRRDAELARL